MKKVIFGLSCFNLSLAILIVAISRSFFSLSSIKDLFIFGAFTANFIIGIRGIIKAFEAD